MHWAVRQTVAIVFTCFYLLAQGDGTHQIIQALRNNNPAEAKRLAEAALQQSSPNAPLWTLKGMACLRLQQKEEALQSFERALQLNPDYPAALEGAAELEYARGSQKAVPLLERLVHSRPADPTTHAMLASLAYQRKDCGTALTEFALSHPATDSQVLALQQEGTCLLKKNQPEAGLPIFERLLQLQSGDSRARYNLAVVQSLAGHPSDVITTLRPLTAGDSPDPDALDLLAEAYEATGDTPQAVKYLRQAILLKPTAADYYLDFANLSLVHNSYAVGTELVSLGLKRLPNSAPLYLARGILYVYMGEYAKSQADFAKAESLDPHSTDASAALGLAALQTDDPHKAEALLRERIRKQPDNAFLFYLLGETLLRGGAATGSPAFHEAMQSAQKAVQIQPNLAIARDLLGRLYLQQGETERAIEESRLAVRDNPADQSALYHLILALKRAGRNSEVPDLTQQLAQLRTAARKKESDEHKFALVEAGVGEPSK